MHQLAAQNSLQLGIALLLGILNLLNEGRLTRRHR